MVAGEKDRFAERVGDPTDPNSKCECVQGYKRNSEGMCEYIVCEEGKFLIEGICKKWDPGCPEGTAKGDSGVCECPTLYKMINMQCQLITCKENEKFFNGVCIPKTVCPDGFTEKKGLCFQDTPCTNKGHKINVEITDAGCSGGNCGCSGGDCGGGIDIISDVSTGETASTLMGAPKSETAKV